MSLFKSSFKWAALIIGGPIVLALVALMLLVPLRYAWVEWKGPTVDARHMQAKLDYLSALEPVSKDQPNIVLIMFDDLGWGDLSSYGNALINTPRMDALAEEGLRMTDFYSASPVCSPSRAALLTGRMPPRTRTDKHVFFPSSHPIGAMRRIMGLANELPKEEITLAEVLKETGYVTQMVGKWHLGNKEGYRPNDFGFDDWYGVLHSNDMYPFDLFKNDQVLIQDQRKGGWFAAETDEQNPLPGNGIDQRQLTRKYTEEAVSFIQNAEDKPFFLYLAHSLPHVPLYADPEFAGTSEAGVYGDAVEDLDRSTGSILDAIDRAGISENTIVIVTSDNGADYNGSSGHLRGRKQQTLEGGQRVPMILRWPGRVEAGTVSSAMAMNTDLFPTLLSLLNIPQPQDRNIDGTDISGVFLNGTESPHDVLYYFPTIGTEPVAIRNDTFKLSINPKDRGRRRPHLSRLDLDNEAHDLSAKHVEVLDELITVLTSKADEVVQNPRGWK
ncbi:N-acetylgalactosamine-6-O-sulfatase [Ruegeria sp. THAF57]|uniref:sulfatase family protein n=1 Tax=Ruegeria sp. THAF57 TaxID=2744555 RepID=UPI0015DF12CD|nr:sulfatase [Ruegeria sp. THAF57]CAD0183957.1 N-acetylgalactosamine-6-O-sulfatase [Ruegeria sp. THAF57]